jgi:hypothetical protein
MAVMAAEQFVNVTYRGLELGRRLRVSQFGPMTAYLEHSTPMPVGTELAMHTDEGLQVAVRVLRVQEQVAGAQNPPGMRVAAAALDDQARAWWSGLVNSSDPLIPEPMLGTPDEAAEQAEAAEAAQAEAAEAADFADAEAEAAELAGEQVEATGADDVQGEGDEGDEGEYAEGEGDEGDEGEYAEGEDADAEGEDADGEDAEGDEAGDTLRDGSPTEKMSAAEIQALVAGGGDAGAGEAGESAEGAGPSSDASDSEDSSSRGKRRRRGRRRGKNRG